MFAMTNQSLTVQANKLGLDIFKIYQASCINDDAPVFFILYDEYKTEILKISNWQYEEQNEEIKKLLKRLEEGSAHLFQLEQHLERCIAEDIPFCPEPELFNLLLQQNYCFKHQNEYFNIPFVEVW